jgi:predicted PolB exonuclease-like 3'-5' exonuclease
MQTTRPLDQLMFLDIETTSQYPSYQTLPQPAKDLFYRRWQKPIEALALENFQPLPATEGAPMPPSEVMGFARAVEEIYNQNAPLFPEWNKVICISMGTLDIKNPAEYVLRTVSIGGENEKQLLETFLKVAQKISKPAKLADAMSDTSAHIVAHNGLYFDIPVMAKRMIYNGIKPPFMLSLGGMKPWDVKWVIDTKEYWKMGVFDAGHNVSLDQLAYSFGVPSSKAIMQGKDVKDVYWNAMKEENVFAKKNAITSIETYCEADILALCRIYLKMMLVDVPVKAVKLDLDKVMPKETVK